MIKASEFPRDKYAGYFEFIPGEKGNVTARVYPLPSGAPVAFDGKQEAADLFVRAQMEKLKRGDE